MLQVIAPGDDYPDTHGAKIKQQTEVVKITVKERILIVPFDLKRYTIFEAIYGVGGRLELIVVY